MYRSIEMCAFVSLSVTHNRFFLSFFFYLPLDILRRQNLSRPIETFFSVNDAQQVSLLPQEKHLKNKLCVQISVSDAK